MNRDLKYIYPVSRVQSIEQLLRVTAHNAFFVVSPSSTTMSRRVDQTDAKECSIEDEAKLIPQLYKRDSILLPVRPSTTIYEERSIPPISAINSLTRLEPITESAATPFEDGPTPPLTFHGIILRSQLVTLLDQKIFFNESDGVSVCS